MKVTRHDAFKPAHRAADIAKLRGADARHEKGAELKRREKFAVVSEARQGIGREGALALAAEGAEVWATDINAQLLEVFQGVPRVKVAPVDGLSKEAITRLIESRPALDIPFTCAGVVHQSAVLDANDEDWALATSLNVPQYCAIQAALPRMLRNNDGNGSGSIIDMASVCSGIKGFSNRFIYGTSKAAFIGLTTSVAADYVSRGIRCNAICPGTVDTPSLQRRIDGNVDPMAARQALVGRQPMGWLATAAEIAPLVVFLVSDESSFVTGQACAVDYGITI